MSRKQSAKWRLLHMGLDVELADPSPSLQEAVLRYKAWRARLHSVPLDDSTFVKSLYVQALQLGKAAADLADRAAATQFARHLQEGPAKGLKHQHRLSRCAVGWIPATVAPVEQGDHSHDLEEYSGSRRCRQRPDLSQDAPVNATDGGVGAS